MGYVVRKDGIYYEMTSGMTGEDGKLTTVGKMVLPKDILVEAITEYLCIPTVSYTDIDCCDLDIYSSLDTTNIQNKTDDVLSYIKTAAEVGLGSDNPSCYRDTLREIIRKIDEVNCDE